MVWKGSGCVLVVDDEPMVREYAVTVLQRAGFRVLEAADGEEGVEIYRENAEDLVLSLLDLNMPKMGGDQVFQVIRELDRKANVILCSGYDQELDPERVVGAPPIYLRKPYRTADLVNTVRRVLGAESDSEENPK